jgi:hypothetical protein
MWRTEEQPTVLKVLARTIETRESPPRARTAHAELARGQCALPAHFTDGRMT